VVGVGREVRLRIGVVERLGEEDLVDGCRGRLDVSSASEILADRLSHEVPERHPPRLRGVGGAPVKIHREEELRPVHV
jgi:hypothetical protein